LLPNTQLLLEAANRLADSTLRDAAISQAMVVKSQAEESGFYALNGAARGRLFAPSFFVVANNVERSVAPNLAKITASRI
jgi:hypothetical protein